MHVIQQAFGGQDDDNNNVVDLYKDVLKCPKNANKAQLRKAYYRSALQYHPDKNPNGHLKFQAINITYQILQNDELRSIYDETGEIPDFDDDDDDDDTTNNKTGVGQWKQYFDKIFGRVTTNGIEAFAMKYKCSDEERRDVLKQFVANKGNLTKMLDFVMLSEPCDTIRWVTDYIRPALLVDNELDDVPPSFVKTMEKTLRKLQKQIEKEEEQDEEEEPEQDEDEVEDDAEEEDDDDATETEEEDDDEEQDDEPTPSPAKRPKKSSEKEASAAKTTTATAAAANKKKKRKSPGGNGDNNMSDLIAKIQNKNRRGNSNNGLEQLGARYGVSLPDDDDNDDPLADDDEFNKIQARLVNKKRK